MEPPAMNAAKVHQIEIIRRYPSGTRVKKSWHQHRLRDGRRLSDFWPRLCFSVSAVTSASAWITGGTTPGNDETGGDRSRRLAFTVSSSQLRHRSANRSLARFIWDRGS